LKNPEYRGGFTLPFREWDLGSIGHYAGYYCSWCYNPEGIRTKLLSAQKDDKPRWGNYPEKTDLKYIEKLIRIGGWFDDTRPFIKTSHESHPNNYAPKYILDNKEKFKYLLDPAPTLASDIEKKNKIQPEEYDIDLLNEKDGLSI
jgi:beta-1,4-mannosyl-glycoprotein beta-1,4-N-acetylglucosaminyltransferase